MKNFRIPHWLKVLIAAYVSSSLFFKTWNPANLPGEYLVAVGFLWFLLGVVISDHENERPVKKKKEPVIQVFIIQEEEEEILFHQEGFERYPFPKPHTGCETMGKAHDFYLYFEDENAQHFMCSRCPQTAVMAKRF